MLYGLKLKDILFKWNEKNKDNSINYVESISNKYGFISQADQFEDRQEIKETSELGNLTISVPRDLSEQEKAFGRMLRREVKHLSSVRSINAIEYISAHSASQKVLFSIEDKNDYMASVIRGYKQCRIGKGDKEDIFITRWMKELNIGLDYQIDSHSGEAYTVNITNMLGETMPLADMGMGSIQMMLLLLKLASIINKRKGEKCTIIVEEPEQNIHPKLQSKLSDLFLYVNKKYGIEFVIETHSEYMIRKSQVQVAAMQFANQEDLDQNCPIKTYYFPEDGEPYMMEYRTDGKFKNGFGNGFYDEAANLAFDIM